MTASSAKLLVYTSETMACIKVAGRANMASSIDFKRVVNELLDKGFKCLVLDLSECLLMDSTFLGVLAGFGLRTKMPQNGDPVDRKIELLNPNPRITELLENLGVAHLFMILREPLDDAADKRNGHIEAPCTEVTREEVTRNCLEAHQILMAIHPDNASKFKDVAQFLSENLEKRKGH